MDKDKLNNLRHSCAHLLAAAVMKLWPGTKRAIGPATENGFYFDFEFKTPISENDFAKIEQKMHELVKTWQSFDQQKLSADEAKKEYPQNEFKHELIDEFAQSGQKLVFYKSGDYWDLCKGGHCDNPAQELKYFKLLSIAGAYWRGSEKNKMLTRIYGTCFPTREELDRYLWQLEEAKKRDHRKIGREQNLFVISPEIGGGLPLFTPRGNIIRREIEQYLVSLKQKNGYSFVSTPHIASRAIYEQSKHWGKYDAMFQPMKIDDDEYVLKPMNCPHHFMIYLSQPKSYRELPIRLAENGTVYRNEKSGELNGLLRVRAATIDDTHTFVRNESKYVAEELIKVVRLIQQVIKDFGFTSYKVRISTRDKKDITKYIGDQQIWDMAEAVLIQVAKDQSINFFVGEGEAAFYGPKIDFMIEDAIGREWQCSTVQLDFQQPVNFQMKYTNELGNNVFVAVLHIAMIGSIERFIGVLIEHYAGVFPLWLSPVQVAVLPVSDNQSDHAADIYKQLLAEGIRAELNSENKTLGAKIRDATLQKIPYLCIIGEREAKEKKSVSVRTRSGEDLGPVSIDQFLIKIKQEIENKLSTTGQH